MYTCDFVRVHSAKTQRSRFAHALRFARASALFFAALNVAFARPRTRFSRTLRARKSRAFRVRTRSKTCARRTKTFRGFRGENDAARAFRSQRFRAQKKRCVFVAFAVETLRAFSVCALAQIACFCVWKRAVFAQRKR
eukprot:gene17687-biopygen15929